MSILLCSCYAERGESWRSEGACEGVCANIIFSSVILNSMCTQLAGCVNSNLHNGMCATLCTLVVCPVHHCKLIITHCFDSKQIHWSAYTMHTWPTHSRQINKRTGGQPDRPYLLRNTSVVKFIKANIPVGKLNLKNFA